MTKIVLITGTPGTGKTTITQQLSQSGFLTFNLFDIAKELGCLGDKDELRDAVIVDDDCIYQQLQGWITKQDEKLLVLEGHYADAVPKEDLLFTFVLQPSIEVLRPRLVDRGYSIAKINENIEAHIMKECLYDALEYYGEEKVEEIDPSKIDNLKNYIIDRINQEVKRV